MARMFTPPTIRLSRPAPSSLPRGRSMTALASALLALAAWPTPATAQSWTTGDATLPSTYRPSVPAPGTPAPAPAPVPVPPRSAVPVATPVTQPVPQPRAAPRQALPGSGPVTAAPPMTTMPRSAEAPVAVDGNAQAAAIMAFGRSSGAIEDQLARWRSLQSGGGSGFYDRAQFLVANPGWPGEEQVRRDAERAIPLTGQDPRQTLAFFGMHPPLTVSGHLRMAQALLATGRSADAAAALRRAWTGPGGTLDLYEEQAALAGFGGMLTIADHDARMDRLIWQGQTAAAQRQLPWTSAQNRAIFAARLAMRSGAPDAGLRAAEAERMHPDLAVTDPGYIADKATWLRAQGNAFGSRSLLSVPRRLTRVPADAEEWYETLLTNARGAATDGNHQLAYQIARQIDDGVPVGYDLRSAPIGVRDDYTSLAWLGGTTALRRLGRPAEAAQLFRRYAAAARSPQTQAKGHYWTGRAAQASGDQAGAQAAFAEAARHYDQFYGQLALERLGQPQPRPTPPAAVSYSAMERDAFTQRSVVRAARALGQQGQWKDQTLFLRAIANRATSDSEHWFGGLLAQEIGRPDLGVMVGRSARINGMADYVPSSYPTLTVPYGHEGNWTFIHAITRQESQFDREALSHAGARGLMQLMPGTAREQAGKLGLSYELGALTRDTGYNVQLGSSYFERMLRYYGGSYPLAVAAYNAGPGNVNRWLAQNGDPRMGGIDILDWIEAIPIFETRDYVQRVLENAVVYDTLHPNPQRRMPANPLSFYLGKRTPG